MTSAVSKDVHCCLAQRRLVPADHDGSPMLDHDGIPMNTSIQSLEGIDKDVHDFFEGRVLRLKNDSDEVGKYEHQASEAVMLQHLRSAGQRHVWSSKPHAQGITDKPADDASLIIPRPLPEVCTPRTVPEAILTRNAAATLACSTHATSTSSITSALLYSTASATTPSMLYLEEGSPDTACAAVARALFVPPAGTHHDLPSIHEHPGRPCRRYPATPGNYATILTPRSQPNLAPPSPITPSRIPLRPCSVGRPASRIPRRPGFSPSPCSAPGTTRCTAASVHGSAAPHAERHAHRASSTATAHLRKQPASRSLPFGSEKDATQRRRPPLAHARPRSSSQPLPLPARLQLAAAPPGPSRNVRVNAGHAPRGSATVRRCQPASPVSSDVNVFTGGAPFPRSRRRRLRSTLVCGMSSVAAALSAPVRCLTGSHRRPVAVVEPVL